MRKGITMARKSIVAYDTGEQIGKVDDLVLDLSNNCVQGFSVRATQQSQNGQMLRFRDVQAFGPSAIIVASRTAIVPAEQLQAHEELARQVLRKRLKLMTTDGYDVGILVDVYFNERTGTIEGYEVEGDLLDEQSLGRYFVPAPKTLKVGADVAFVPADTLDLMKEKESQGIETAGLGHEATRPAATGENSGQQVTRIEEIKGRRVQHIVQTGEGVVVAAQGQIVTDAIITQARKYQQEKALLAAVTARSSGVMGVSGERLKRAGERLRGTTNVAVENAEKVWERVREGVSDLHAAEHLKRVGEQLRENTTSAVKTGGKLWERVREGVSELGLRRSDKSTESKEPKRSNEDT